MMKKRLLYGIATVILLIIEVIIGLYAHGWIRNYLGDVLVVILLYTLYRTIIPERSTKWYLHLGWSFFSYGDSATDLV